MHQSEQILEENLIKQLNTLGYTYVNIPDESALLSNLKTQLEKFNNITTIKIIDNFFISNLLHFLTS